MEPGLLGAAIGEAMCRVGAPVAAALGMASNSCIASTRIALEVSRHFKVNAKPLLVQASFFNEVFQNELKAGNARPLDNPKAWSTAGGIQPDKPTEFWGHLVLLLTGERHRLIDGTAAQFARPEHGIPERNFHAAVPQTFPNEPWGHAMGGGAFMYYRRAVTGVAGQERIYRAAPDWQIGPLHRRVIDEVIAAVEAAEGDPAKVQDVEVVADEDGAAAERHARS